MSKDSEPESSRIEAANRLLAENRLDEARRIYEGLCTPDQQVVSVWLNLALVYRKTGSFEQAHSVCLTALSLRDDYAPAHHIYGSVLQCQGRLDDAIASYRRALVLDPSLAEAHYFLGNALQMTGNPVEAVECYRSAIELRPDYLEALGNLGAVLIGLHRYDDAQSVLQRANQLCPQSTQILCNLGDLALTRDDLDRAESHARAALKVDPGFFDAHTLLGKIYRKRGDFDRVLEHYTNARFIRPGNENVLAGIAEILEMRGEFEAAHGLLEPLIAKGSLNPLVLRVFSALSRHFREERRAIGLLEQALQGGRLDFSQRIRLHSELGKQYDGQGEYRQAFSHYRRANELEKQLNADVRKKSGPGFPAAALIDKWFLQFDTGYWRQLARSGVDSRRPVFVVGMPRSGTTLAEQILARHPDIHGAGELPCIPDQVQQLRAARPGPGYIEFLGGLTRRELATAAREYLAASDLHAGDALRVVDKMPMNFWHLGFIALILPGARIIHMRRDPRDTCLSVYFQRFDSSMTFTTDLEELAAYYSAYSRIMEYWHTVLDTEIMDVHYEDLVADQENVIRRMIGFCGLEWDAGCLDFHKGDRDVNTPSYDQVRKPMYNSSVGRWKNYSQQLTPLIDALDLDG